MLIMVFALQLGWLPSTGPGATPALLGVHRSFLIRYELWHMLLPALNLSLFNIALVLCPAQAGMREALPMDFIRFARTKGLLPGGILLMHVLKNIMLPIATIVGLEPGSTLPSW